jgi:hypothetical protein
MLWAFGAQQRLPVVILRKTGCAKSPCAHQPDVATAPQESRCTPAGASFFGIRKLAGNFLQPETSSGYLFYSETVSDLSVGDADVNSGAILRVAS